MSDIHREYELLHWVKAAFADELQRGALHVLAYRYDGECFGNACVELGARTFKLRIVNDRGCLFAECTRLNAPDEWRPLDTMLERLGLKVLEPTGKDEAWVREVGKHVGENFDALLSEFSASGPAKS